MDVQKVVQINDETTRSLKEMHKGESNEDIDAEKEGPADDGSSTKDDMENRVKFPSSTPKEVVELYRKIDLQRRELER